MGQRVRRPRDKQVWSPVHQSNSQALYEHILFLGGVWQEALLKRGLLIPLAWRDYDLCEVCLHPEEEGIEATEGGGVDTASWPGQSPHLKVNLRIPCEGESQRSSQTTHLMSCFSRMCLQDWSRSWQNRPTMTIKKLKREVVKAWRELTNDNMTSVCCTSQDQGGDRCASVWYCL